MIVPGDTITVWAKVTGKREAEGLGVIDMDVGMRLQYDAEILPRNGDHRVADKRRPGDPVSVRCPEGRIAQQPVWPARPDGPEMPMAKETMGRWIAIGKVPGWNDLEKFTDELKPTAKWRVDPRTTITTVMVLADGRIVAMPRRQSGGFRRAGWQRRAGRWKA